MDFSINKSSNIRKNLNFKGLEGAYNKTSTPVFKFYAPAHKKNEEVYLEITLLRKDEETKGFKDTPFSKVFTYKMGADDVLEIPQKNVKKQSQFFAYRYKIVSKDKNGQEHSRYSLDPSSSATLKINGKNVQMNVIDQGNFYGVSPKGGTMYHGFLDSYTDQNKMDLKLHSDFVRNHFNKLGGTMKGMLYLLNSPSDKNNVYKELEPYRYIMTNPEIGNDKISSHKYWPNNQYQCSDLDTFKKFNYELFKIGKGYVADGAFTSVGLNSYIFKHVLKWGEKSPFYNMIKTQGPIALGILPDRKFDDVFEDAYNHIGVRIVNKPQKDGYEADKPTYIQFFDDRLLSEEKRNDNKELYYENDISPKDNYEITSHQDSTQPYAFEIPANSRKLKVFEKSNSVLLKDIPNISDFLTFENFSITTKDNVQGISCWDGNVDIVKMNLSNPLNYPENKKGLEEARNYIYGCADYWSELIQSDLVLNTAKETEDAKKQIAKENAIDEKQFEEIEATLDKMDSLILSQNKKAIDYAMAFPFQSVEFPDEVCAILAIPGFGTNRYDKPSIREDLAQTLDDVVNSSIPDEYSGNSDYKEYVLKTYSNEILRYVCAHSIMNCVCNDGGIISKQELENSYLPDLIDHEPVSVEDEQKQLQDAFSHGLKNFDSQALVAKIKKELECITLKDFKLAEAIVLQGKGGLNWRFDAAKDIGDLDSIRSMEKTFDAIWNDDGVEQFWSEFVSRIRKNNPSAYIINEITCLGDFHDDSTRKRVLFDEKLLNGFEKLTPDQKRMYEYNLPYQEQVSFINRTNSTTASEFDKGFNKFSNFIGVDPEFGKDVSSSAGDLYKLQNAMESLENFNQPNTAIFCHQFTNNHDKPTILHTLPLDMNIYLSEYPGDIEDKSAIEKIKKLTNRSDLKLVSFKAAAVGLAFDKVIDKLYKNDETSKQKLKTALRELVNGQKDQNSPYSYKRAERFGVMPYEITVQDLFKKADMCDEQRVLDFHSELIKNPMMQYERLWQVMNACVGTPTLFSGAEFAQTGYETASKNVYLSIRNEILHGLKNDKRYKPYYDKMQAISALYKKPHLSALREGTPISLEIFEDGDFQTSFWPVLKYDSKNSKTISIISNLGIGRNAKSYQAKDTLGAHTLKQIPLRQSELSHEQIRARYNDANSPQPNIRKSLMFHNQNTFAPLEVEAELGRYVYDEKKGDYVIEDVDYIINQNGAIQRKDGKDIVLDDTVSTFFVK